MIKHAIRNSEIIEEKDATVSVVNREVQYSFSVYEGLKVLNSKVVLLEDHVKRLKLSASTIGLEMLDYDFEADINKLIEVDNIKEATLRVLVIGGADPTCFITWTTILSYPDEYYINGVSVYSYKGERFLPSCKTSNILLNYLALEEAKRHNGFEALLVNKDNLILEGSRTNFFALKGNNLYTAKDDLVLEGITRKYILRAAEEMGLNIHFEAINLDDVLLYDGLFISSTSMVALPISSLDGKNIPLDKRVLELKRLTEKYN